MTEFAKIFIVERKGKDPEQVLIMRDYDAHEDTDDVLFIFNNHKMSARMTLKVSFDNTERAEELFKSIDLGKATMIFNSCDLRNLMN